MQILPIDAIAEEDVLFVGKELYNLSKLCHHDIPVPQGVVVLPPEIKLQTVLKRFDHRDKERFEQSLEIIRREFRAIPIPAELEGVLKKKSVDSKKIWQGLLDEWLGEIRSRIWREGFSPNMASNLKSHPVFFTNEIKSSGQAYFDIGTREVIINLYTGELTHQQILELEEIITKASKKLFLSFIFEWIFDGKLQIIKLSSYTPDYTKKSHKLIIFNNLVNQSGLKLNKKPRLPIKIFLNSSKELILDNDIDGVLISAEKVGTLDDQLYKFVEIASSRQDIPVIYKLPDIRESFGGIRGTLRLIHQDSLLRESTEVFLFGRNKKNLLNAQLGIPFVRGVNELMQLKRDLAVLGVNRRGSLRMWLELAVPENIINIEDYLVCGIDGVILNLDSLIAWLGGFDGSLEELDFYKKQIKASLNFIKPLFKTLHNASIPILVSGDILLHDEVLKFLMERGVWGISVSNAHQQGIYDYLKSMEKRVISSERIKNSFL